jgi:hypothetical protein
LYASIYAIISGIWRSPYASNCCTLIAVVLHDNMSMSSCRPKRGCVISECRAGGVRKGIIVRAPRPIRESLALRSRVDMAWHPHSSKAHPSIHPSIMRRQPRGQRVRPVNTMEARPTREGSCPTSLGPGRSKPFRVTGRVPRVCAYLCVRACGRAVTRQGILGPAPCGGEQASHDVKAHVHARCGQLRRVLHPLRKGRSHGIVIAVRCFDVILILLVRKGRICPTGTCA